MKQTFLFLFCLLAICAYPQSNTPTDEQKYLADQEKLNQLAASVHLKAAALNSEIEKEGDRIRQDESYREEMMAKFAELNQELSIVLIQFIKENPNSMVSLEGVQHLSSTDIPFPEIETLFLSLSDNIRNSEAGLKLKTRLDATKATAIGSVAPDFTQLDPDDKPIKLSDFRGKYVLIDFWASWCGPCRRENPHIVKAYERFKGDKFEILGVSLDNPGQKQTWLRAVEKDGLTWPQVSDLNGWQNAAALQYGVKSIPQNYLIDPQGVIIAKNLRGEALIKKLEQLFQRKN